MFRAIQLLKNRLLMKADIDVGILSLFRLDSKRKNESLPLRRPGGFGFSGPENVKLGPHAFAVAKSWRPTRKSNAVCPCGGARMGLSVTLATIPCKSKRLTADCMIDPDQRDLALSDQAVSEGTTGIQDAGNLVRLHQPFSLERVQIRHAFTFAKGMNLSESPLATPHDSPSVSCS
jgi:hypothetical protein